MDKTQSRDDDSIAAVMAQRETQSNVIRSLTAEGNGLVRELNALRSWLATLKCDCDAVDRPDEVHVSDPVAHRDYCSYRKGYESWTHTPVDEVRALTE